jgi:hypothetical protein
MDIAGKLDVSYLGCLSKEFLKRIARLGVENGVGTEEYA